MNQDSIFKISYEFGASAQKVFEMWSNPELLSRWLGPEGAEMKFISADVREGGTSRWTMTTPDGLTKFGQIHFTIIRPNTLLIYTQNFCDKDGNFTKAPFSDSYPDYLKTSITFSESDNKTTVTVKWEITGTATDQEKETFASMKEIMKSGWTASFVKLENLLKETHE